MILTYLIYAEMVLSENKYWCYEKKMYVEPEVKVKDIIYTNTMR